MDINNRKTALDDDSVLYQKRSSEQAKEDIKNLDNKGRLRYFIDYYLAKVIVGLIIVALGGNLIYTMFFHHPQTVLHIASIGNTYIGDSDALAEDLRSLYQLTDEDQNIYVSHYNLDDYNQQMAFSTRIAASDIDVVLCDEEQFEKYAKQGLFYDLSALLDQNILTAQADNLIYDSSAETDADGNITELSEEYLMAIDITGNSILEQYHTQGDPLYIGFCVNSERPEQAKSFLDYILENSEATAVQE